jgi:Fe-S oxidoreductase
LNHFPDIVAKYNVKAMHISSFLEERLDKSALSATRTGAKATFHDPCDLGRELGEYDAPRNLVRAAVGTDLIEMERSRNTSSCCGSGSGVKSAYSELAGAIGQERVAMAREAGADLIVTSCPWCLQNLRECQGDRATVEVIDLVDLLEESLGANMKKARGASGQ